MRLLNVFHGVIGALLMLVLAGGAHSQNGSMETGWMELVKGTRDTASGAQLVNIEDDSSPDTQKITLAIPKSSLGNRDQIEEVLVIGQRLDKPEKPKREKITYEWVSDYDSDNYGLVIRLSKNTNWPIRLYMNSEPGFMQ